MNPTKRACSAAAALVLITLSGVAAGAGGVYYRWLDESGTPVNSDRPPPPGISYETIATSTNQTTNEGAGDKATTPGVAPAPASPSGQAETGEQRMVTVKDPEACDIARQNLETLRTHARIRMPDGEGSFRYLSEEEKAAERAKAEAAIKHNCE